MRQLLDDVLADLHVLGEELGEVALVEPVRLPVVDVAHAHRLGMNFLSHRYSFGASVIERWAVRLLIGVARPIAGAEALERGAYVGEDVLDVQLIADQLVVVLGVGDRGVEQLRPVLGDAARRKGQDRACLGHRLAAMWSQTIRALRAEERT